MSKVFGRILSKQIDNFTLIEDLTKISEWITKNVVVKFCDEELEASTFETVFGIEIDLNFNFEDHVNTLYGKATKKLNALQRTDYFIGCSKRNIFQSIM